MDMTTIFSALRELVSILKEGGTEASLAIFILLFLHERRLNTRLTNDLRDVAVAKVEGDVHVERTLNANAQAMTNVDERLRRLEDNTHRLLESTNPS